ncbi:MAG: N-formylglutamate amidohydrolase [Rhodospirillales bacterium]|nr:N-formylglutamate amidohydrolase [Rhodospirillales bacterium]
MNADIIQFPTPLGRLLDGGDPPPFEVINADGSSQMLLICDHASRRVPGQLGDLGLPASEFNRHIAYDVGAEQITRNLSKSMDCRAVLANYSRLVIDLNRPPGHPESVPQISDGTLVPANQQLTEDQLDQRVDTLFNPYHEAVSHSVAHLWNRGPAPVLFSVHSFTPHFKDQPRPWDVGILWKHDPRLAVPLMERLSGEGLEVGNNEPYSALEMAYTIDVHAGAAGLATCVIEIRQDQVADQAGVARWSEMLHRILTEILTDANLYEAREY